MANARWMQIADDFRTAGALLMVVVPMRRPRWTPSCRTSMAWCSWARRSRSPGVRVLAYVSGPTGAAAQPPRASRSVPVEDPEAIAAAPARFPRAAAAARGPAPIRRVTDMNAVPTPPKKRTRMWVVAIWAIALAAEGVWYFMHHRPGGTPTVGDPVPAAADSDSARAATDSAGVPDSAAPPTAPAIAGTARRRAGRQRAPRHPARRPRGDDRQGQRREGGLRRASPPRFSVELLVLPSATAANARLATEPIKDLPALTIAPLTEPDGSHSFHVIAGAFNTKDGADSLLATLVKGGVVIAGQGKVVRLPFAVVVQSGVTRDEAFFTRHRLPRQRAGRVLARPAGRAHAAVYRRVRARRRRRAPSRQFACQQ